MLLFVMECKGRTDGRTGGWPVAFTGYASRNESSSGCMFWRTIVCMAQHRRTCRGAVYSDDQQTSALSCATVLYLDFVVPPQLCDGSTVIHDICSSSSSSSSISS